MTAEKNLLGIETDLIIPEELYKDKTIACVFNHVRMLRDQFYRDHPYPPQYIKMPSWIVSLLYDAREKVAYLRVPNKETLYGLVICGTLTIQSIDEIELF